MTINLLAKDGISENGRIIIAGSELARGDGPGANLPDFEAVAKESFNGSLHDMLKAYAKGSYPSSYVTMNSYAVAKLYVAWWSAGLAKRLPKGMTVNTVSPGFVPGTGLSRHMPRSVRGAMIKVIAPLFGMAGPINAAAKRYLDVVNYANDISGKFFASPPNKFAGKLEEQNTSLIQNTIIREAAYKLIVELSHGIDYQNI
jgi:NAD(P)-dependent dehydrogenase (short-subunit alcohol dehydrogenase family)